MAHRQATPLATALSTALRGLNSALHIERAWLGYAGPLEARIASFRIAAIVRACAPDLVHALRIPLEGESTIRITGTPRALSVWGNDFTLWATRYGGHKRLMSTALRSAHGLHADCYRDIRLAAELGFNLSRPHLVTPSGGGIDAKSTIPEDRVHLWRARLNLPSEASLVINPRGARGYVCTEAYLRSIPVVLRERPATVFVSIGLAGDPRLERLNRELAIDSSHHMLPTVSQQDLAALFELAEIMVSPTIHDGTPNTLLESMAQGAFPVAGDLESIREWINDGVNGLLVDPKSPASIARGILRALSDSALRSSGIERNHQLVRERADYATSMARVRDFYREVIALNRRV